MPINATGHTTTAQHRDATKNQFPAVSFYVLDIILCVMDIEDASWRIRKDVVPPKSNGTSSTYTVSTVE